MSHNNATSAMPGFFFYPSDTTGLVELTFDERCTLLLNQGNYMVSLWMHDPVMRGDLDCSLDNCRIPTHRLPYAEIPAYGHVPFDMSEYVNEITADYWANKSPPSDDKAKAKNDCYYSQLQMLHDFLKSTADDVSKRRCFNNASLSMKVMHKRALELEKDFDSNDG